MPYETTRGRLVENLPFWGNLTEQERELVLDRQAVTHYRAGQHVWHSQMECLGLLMVIRGGLRTYLLSPGGREVTLYRVRAGEICLMSASCVLHALAFDTQVEAEEDSEVIVLPIHIFSRLMDNIHVECHMYRLAAERFSDVVTGMERLVFMTLEQRLCAFLIDLAAERQSDILHITHEQIATHIGSAREAVSRAVGGLASAGAVEPFRGGVRITDKAALYVSVGRG